MNRAIAGWQEEHTTAEVNRTYRILVVVTEPPQEQHLRRYATALGARQGTEIGVLRDYERRIRHASCCQVELPVDEGRGTVTLRQLHSGIGRVARVLEIAANWPFDMLIAPRPDCDDEVAIYPRLVKDLDVIAVLVRHSKQKICRVLVPAGGGAHALEGIRVADTLARTWSLSSQVLRIVQPGSDFWMKRADLKLRCRHIRDATRLYVDVADVEMPIKVRLGSDIADEIICRSRPSDLIVIGGSSQWLMENHASTSIPGRVTTGAAGPVVMVLTNRGRPSALTDVFWERTIGVRLEAPQKHSAVGALVDTLIESRQVPAVRRDEVVGAVMDRERAGTTYIGHGTAVPHASLRNFRGLTP